MPGDEYLEDDPPVELDVVTGEEVPPGEPKARGPVGGWPDDEPEEEIQFGPEDPGPEARGAEAVGPAASGKSPNAIRAIIGAVAAGVVAAAIGLAVVTNSGSDDSAGVAASTTVERDAGTTSVPTAAGAAVVDPSTTPIMGRQWLLLARNSSGHTGKGTQIDHYLRALLEFAPGQALDEQKPRYVVTRADAFFPAVNQPEQDAACTLKGKESHAKDVSDSFHELNHLGFDLTTDPITYFASFLTTGLDRKISRTCEGSVGENNYGDVIVWANTSDNEAANTFDRARIAQQPFVGFYQQGGAHGFSRVYWWLGSCDWTGCVSLNEEIKEVVGKIDRSVPSGLSE